jgi:5-formyltetrahydrofolate cyclo-ligase
MKEAQKKGKRILLPFIDQKVRQMHPSLLEDLEHDLVCGSYGIMEPKLEKRKKIELNEIGLALVPGLAFDRTGNRLGRGQGYYDRFLSLLPKQVKCVGLAFDFQVLDQIPVSDSDIRLDLIVTNDSNYGND